MNQINMDCFRVFRCGWLLCWAYKVASIWFTTLAWHPSMLWAQDATPNNALQDDAAPIREFRTVEQWQWEIRKLMLYQDFRNALRLCLEAQQQYPQEEVFRDYEASIREYLQTNQRNRTSTQGKQQDNQLEDEQLEIVQEEPPPEPTLQERLVIAAKQDPLLSAYGGFGLHWGTTAGGMSALNPLAQAGIQLYFSPSLGIQLFYYGAHWNLQLAHTAGRVIDSPLYSLAFGGSLRFGNKVRIISGRSALSFAVDIGALAYDVFPQLEYYQPQLSLFLGFNLSDRPFYHFLGIEAMAGLQLDLNFSLYLSTEPNIPSIVQTSNWEAILWHSFGILRLGLSYRGSTNEHYNQKYVLFVQHQFALLFGLEWRTAFRP